MTTPAGYATVREMFGSAWANPCGACRAITTIRRGHAARAGRGAVRELRRLHDDLGNWRLVMLDSCVAGPGTRATLVRCRTGATRCPHWRARASATCSSALHHHPVRMSSRWIDSVGLQNPQTNVFARHRSLHPQVRAMLWGHVHQSASIRAARHRATCWPCLPPARSSCRTPTSFAIDTESTRPTGAWTLRSRWQHRH